MTIAETLVLPAQPALGSTEFIPLGGNGYTAPQSAFLVDMQVLGDASGGNISTRIDRDPRFEHLISLMQVESNNTAAVGYLFNLTRSVIGTVGTLHQVGTTILDGITDITLSSALWTPPPMIEPFLWQMFTENVDTFTVKFKCLVYNFQIDASQKIPLSTLLASVPRASSVV